VPYDPLMRWEWEGGAVSFDDDVAAEAGAGDDRGRDGDGGVVHAEPGQQRRDGAAGAIGQRVAKSTKIAAAA
jgi:hypothetical protein